MRAWGREFSQVLQPGHLGDGVGDSAAERVSGKISTEEEAAMIRRLADENRRTHFR